MAVSKKCVFIGFAVFFCLISRSAFATESEDSSPALQLAKRVALYHNTKDLPSRGYQLSSFAVKRSKQLQAVRLKGNQKNSSGSAITQ